MVKIVISATKRCEATRGSQVSSHSTPFYMDRATEELALEKKIPFVRLVKANRFKGVTKPGQWDEATYKDTKELYVHYWSRR